MKRVQGKDFNAEQLRTLKDILIVQLLLAAVGQAETAKVAKVDIHRVNQIAKLLKKSRKESER